MRSLPSTIPLSMLMGPNDQVVLLVGAAWTVASPNLHLGGVTATFTQS